MIILIYYNDHSCIQFLNHNFPLYGITGNYNLTRTTKTCHSGAGRNLFPVRDTPQMDAGSEPPMTGWCMIICFWVVEKIQTMCCISATVLWQSLIKRTVKQKALPADLENTGQASHDIGHLSIPDANMPRPALSGTHVAILFDKGRIILQQRAAAGSALTGTGRNVRCSVPQNNRERG